MEDTNRARHELENSPALSLRSADQRRPQAGVKTEEDAFDPTSAAERLGGEPLLRKIIVLFLKNIPDLLEEIGGSIARSDCMVLERSAHTLASSMAYLSARSASEAALALEQMGRESDLLHAAPAYEQLHAEVERLKTALSAFVSKESSP